MLYYESDPRGHGPSPRAAEQSVQEDLCVPLLDPLPIFREFDELSQNPTADQDDGD